jgi:hypothetical protein
MSLFAALRRKDRAVGSGEDGAVAVLIALLMVVLLGFAAIVIDVGSMYAQRAQLQNGADAAVLAIAQDCAKNGLTVCKTNAPGKAQTLAAANVNNGLVGTGTPSFPTTNSVKETLSAGKDGSGLDLSFAPVLGINKADVNATASAAWGSPIRGNAILPVGLSQCEFTQYGFRGSTEFVMRYDNTNDTTCNGRGGKEIAGGFYWLKHSSTSCSTFVDLTAPQTPRDPSPGFPDICRDSLNSLKTASTVLLPVYDLDSPSNASYTNKTGFSLYTFAAFKITGWKFSETDSSLRWNLPASQCGTGCLGIKGYFTQFVSVDGSFELGGPANGATVIKLTL